MDGWDGLDWSAVVDGAFDDPAGRLLEVQVAEGRVGDEVMGVLRITFTVEDLRGRTCVATGRIFLPRAVATGEVRRAPVWFACGYELHAEQAAPHVALGRIVATTCDPVGDAIYPFHNPLARGPAMDHVLAHLVRGLPFVDPAQVVYAGGSAGGWAALLVAAQAFPAAGVVAETPPVNLVYQGAYGLDTWPRLATSPPADQPLVGVLAGVLAQVGEEGLVRAYGREVSAPAWWQHSPLAHLDAITAPVMTFFSTADVLVPVVQVDEELGAAAIAAAPDGLNLAPGVLTDAPLAAATLVGALGGRAAVVVLPLPEGAARTSLAEVDLTRTRPRLGVPVPARTPSGQDWLVAVLDEGPPALGAGHTAHAVSPDTAAWVEVVLAAQIAVEQLSPAKLGILLDRWTGMEWLAPGFHHRDQPAAERADVARGLRVYCSTSPRHAAHFAQHYAALPEHRRVLPESLVAELVAHLDAETQRDAEGQT